MGHSTICFRIKNHNSQQYCFFTGKKFLLVEKNQAAERQMAETQWGKDWHCN